MNRFRSEQSIKDRQEREQAGKEAAQKAIAEGKSLKEVQQAQKDAEKKVGSDQKEKKAKDDLGKKSAMNKALGLTGSLFQGTKEAREAGREAAEKAAKEGKTLQEVQQAKKDAIQDSKNKQKAEKTGKTVDQIKQERKEKKDKQDAKARESAGKQSRFNKGMDMFRSKESKEAREAGRKAAEEAAKDPTKSLENIEKAKKDAMEGKAAEQKEAKEAEKLSKQKEKTNAAFANLESNLANQADEEKREAMERLADYKNKCSNDPETLKKITDLYISEKMPTDEMNPWVSTAKNSKLVAKKIYDALGSTTYSGLGRILTFSLPRVLHSINKLLNYFEFHELSSLLILLFKNFKNQGLFKITKIKSSLKDDLINRYLFAESSINQFIEENSFKDLNDINKGIVFGYLHFEIEKSSLDQLQENDKYYLKMLSNIIVNLKLKNQLIDILSRLYLNNINVTQFTLVEKDIWFKRYFTSKKGQLQYLIKPSKSKKFKSYTELEKYYKKDPQKYKESMLKVNALICYTEAFSMMFDHMEHPCFLSPNENCSTLNLKKIKEEKKSKNTKESENIKEEKESNKNIQKGGKLSKTRNRFHDNDNYNKFIGNNIELFYNKKKILKNKKNKKNKKKSKTLQNVKVILKKNKKTKKNKKSNKNKTKKVKK